MSNKIKLAIIGVVISVAPLIWCFAANAAAHLTVQSVTVVNKSTDVVAENPTVSGNTVTSAIVFHALDDYVKYNLDLKNTTGTSFKILDITDDNSNELVEYSYDNHADEVIDAGESLNLELTITYIQEHLDDSDRTLNNNVTFTISYLDLHTGAIEEDDVVLVPNTGANAAGTVDGNFVPGIIIFVAVFAGVVFVVALLKKKKGVAALSILAVVFAGSFALNLGAVAEDYLGLNINLNSEIRLRDYFYGEIFWKNPMTGEDEHMTSEMFGADDYIADDILYFGDIFEGMPAPSNYTVKGFKFTGTDIDVDFDAPILDDWSVTVLYDERAFSVSYNYNGGTVASPNSTSVKPSDASFTLVNPTKNTAYFKCWTGTDIYRCQENVTIEPASVYSDLEFTATYQHEVVVKDQNETELDRTFVNEGSNGYYESVDYHTDEFKITGGSCTNGQQIITTNDSYEVKDITSNTVCTVTTAPITYDVELVVNNGSGDGLVTVNKGANVTFENLVADDLYALPTSVNCTNGQNATISNGTVIVSNVTNNTTCTVNALPPSLHTITYMQEMTPEICANTTKPIGSLATAGNDDWDGSHYGDSNYIPRKALIDSRDNKKYLVAKLADGECWMTQNLGLDLSTGTTLTSSNTDLNTMSSYTPARSTENIPNPVSSYSYGTLAAASNLQLSFEPLSQYYVGNGAYTKVGLKRSDSPTSDSDEYLWQSAGNLYSFYAFSAGTYPYDGVSGFRTQDTICPKGWTLPEGQNLKDEQGNYLTDRLPKSYYMLYGAYSPNKDSTEYSEFTKSGIFRHVFAGDYKPYTHSVNGINRPPEYYSETGRATYGTNFIADYYGQSNRIVVAQFTWPSGTSLGSEISAFGTNGLTYRCIAR